MDIKSTLDELRATIEAERGEIVGVSRAIWENPELAFQEFKASELPVGLLRKYGFKVEYPYAGMETAFRAEYTRGNGGATFALAAEYDALAGIGHACGHNTSGVASVAAALAAKAYMDKHGIDGTILVLGTPGEEGGGGKVLMLRNADCLKNVDAVMMSHGGADRTRGDRGSTGIRRYEVIFHGRASHAAGSPEKGINALDAQVLLFNAVLNALPQTRGLPAKSKLLITVVCARVISATVNFFVNNKVVFKGNESLGNAAVKYGSLALCILAVNYALMYLLTIVWAWPLALAKIVVEVLLFCVNFVVQGKFVFRKQSTKEI